ncbi:hypothetical protein BT69DRAFT_1296176 [Atractiella rhizophila]|nr:hypothetical protein BT69DRAFT_1296176 [Atractiella rhizophila]
MSHDDGPDFSQNLSSNLGGIGGHFGLHGSLSDSDIHAEDRSRARNHSDFDLRRRQPVVQSTTDLPVQTLGVGSDLVGLTAFARSYIAIQLTSIHATQVGLQRQFADLVDKFVVSWETPNIIEMCDGWQSAVVEAVQHLLRDHRVVSYKDGFNDTVADYMLERETNGMMLLSLQSIWKNQTMKKKLVTSMDPNAAGGVKNIVHLTVEIVKGHPDISASKELQGRYAFLVHRSQAVFPSNSPDWQHGGLCGKWGAALKIAGNVSTEQKNLTFLYMCDFNRMLWPLSL